MEDLIQQLQPKIAHGIGLLRDRCIYGSVLDCVQSRRVRIPSDELPVAKVRPFDGVGNRFARNRFEAHKGVDLLRTGHGQIMLGLVKRGGGFALDVHDIHDLDAGLDA